MKKRINQFFTITEKTNYLYLFALIRALINKDIYREINFFVIVLIFKTNFS